jgi:hypothetical protein
MPKDFHVVDLDAQADHIARHVQGWSKDAILDWLSTFGQVRKIRPNSDSYVFYAASGTMTGFVLRDSGEFLIVGDHTVRRVDSN